MRYRLILYIEGGQTQFSRVLLLLRFSARTKITKDKHAVDSAIISFARFSFPRELKHARFWDADGNRKRAFLVLGPYCLRDFYTTHLLWRKIISIVNVAVWGQTKSENISLPVAVRVSKTRVLKLPIGAGARFSKLPVITGPVKQFCFPFQMGVSKLLKITQ